MINVSSWGESDRRNSYVGTVSVEECLELRDSSTWKQPFYYIFLEYNWFFICFYSSAIIFIYKMPVLMSTSLKILSDTYLSVLISYVNKIIDDCWLTPCGRILPEKIIITWDTQDNHNMILEKRGIAMWTWLDEGRNDCLTQVNVQVP